jgi:UDP-N-acetylmuramate--alanine ligase
MTIDQIKRIYFIGIGGIGMSALARFFKERDAQVSGYDKTPTPLTRLLEAEGLVIHYAEDIQQLDPNADMVVYTPAIPANHQELIWYQAHSFPVVKRSDVLQMISARMRSICVAGTHGKTTVSTLIAHTLRHTEVGCNAFLGGISVNYGVNYWSSPNDCAVIEADEYDRSFLKLNPAITVVTAMDPDHLDIYGTVEEMIRCYLEFISKTSEVLIYKHGLSYAAQFKVPIKHSYSVQNDAADYYASDIVLHQGAYTFNFCKQGEVITAIALNMGGMHNVENTIAALAVADVMGVDIQRTAQAIADFKGVKRRFEYILRNEEQVFIDDYAHHPEELASLLKSTKALFPTKKLVVVFQPHLYTRTRDLVDGFAASLDLADHIILLDIYPARELPIEGITSEIILNKMSNPNTHILSKQGVLDWVKAARPELLVTAGAGDIDTLVQPIHDILISSQTTNEHEG